MTRMDVQLHGAFEEILVKFSDLLSNNVIEQIEENIKV
jgi:hypothetical protein